MVRVKKLAPVFVFLILNLIVFYQYFLNHQLPIPGDILLGHYHPWSDSYWGGRNTIYPIKNWNAFDGIRQTLPWRLLAVRQMKQGVWPFWNRFSFSGTPLLANWQTAALYPLNFLFWLLPELDAWSVYIILQPFLAALLMFYFLKDLLKKDLPSYFGAICWSLSIVMINHLEFGIDGHAILWLPAALLAVNKLNRKFSIANGLGLSLAVLMSLLAGYPPPAIYCLSLIAAYAIFKIRPIFSLKMFSVLFFLLLALVLSLPQTLPAQQLIKKTKDDNSSKVIDSEYFLPAENLIMTFAPDFFGHQATKNFFSKNYYSDSPAIGAAGFVFFSLSLIILFWQKRKKKKEMIFWWLVVIIPMVLMVKNPISVAFAQLPIGLLSSVSPIKMVWLVSFGLSVLAAISMLALAQFLKNKRAALSLLLPLVLVLFFWFLSFWLIDNPDHQVIAQRNLVIPSFVGLTTLALIFLGFKLSKLYSLFCLLIIFLAAGELVRQTWKYTSFIEPDLVFPKTKITQYLKDHADNNRVIITNGELFPPNANLAYQIAMIDGYASIRDRRYDYLIRLMSGDSTDNNILTPYGRIIYQPEWRSQIASLLRVKYILSIYEIDDPRLNLILTEGRTRLYEKESVFDKAFFVKKYSVEKKVDLIARRMQKIDLTYEAVLEKELGSLDLGVGQVKVVNYGSNIIRLKTKNKKQGLLILTDAYDPGWLARIDGRPTEVLRANLDLRAILVPAGEHEIEFNYLPFGWGKIFD